MSSKDWQLINNVRKNHNYCRSTICGCIQKDQKIIQVSMSDDKQTRYSNTMYCGSPFTCSRCAKIYSAHRIKDVNHILKWVRSEGYKAYFGTMTTPHELKDKLKVTFNNLSTVYSKVFTGSDWKKIKEQTKFLGTVKSFETTFGDNGYHPHYHTLYITKNDIDCAFPLTNKEPKLNKNGTPIKTPLHAETFEEWVYLKMKKMHKKIGIKPPSQEHAFDFKEWGDETGDYIAKFGLSFELTNGTLKKSTDKTTPMLDFLLRDDKEGVLIAREYINFINDVRPRAMYFNKVLDLASELYVKNVQEIIEEHENDDTYFDLFRINGIEYQRLWKTGKIAEFDQYLKEHTNPYNAWSEYYSSNRGFFEDYIQ